MDYKGVIVGLGNPGPKYEKTRHNIGFMLVDHLLSVAEGRKNMRLEKIDESGDYELWRAKFAGAYRLFAKPQTYMNLSGKAVSKICGRHGLKPEQVMVVHDELDLPVGRMKIKKVAVITATTAWLPFRNVSPPRISSVCDSAWAVRRKNSRTSATGSWNHSRKKMSAICRISSDMRAKGSTYSIGAEWDSPLSISTDFPSNHLMKMGKIPQDNAKKRLCHVFFS